MQPETRMLLFDTLTACELIAQFIKGKSMDDYLNDDLLRSGIERQFMIIGEAFGKVMESEPSIADSISNTRRIIKSEMYLFMVMRLSKAKLSGESLKTTCHYYIVNLMLY